MGVPGTVAPEGIVVVVVDAGTVVVVVGGRVVELSGFCVIPPTALAPSQAEPVLDVAQACTEPAVIRAITHPPWPVCIAMPTALGLTEVASTTSYDT
jgi:hypothetical protein